MLRRAQRITPDVPPSDGTQNHFVTGHCTLQGYRVLSGYTLTGLTAADAGQTSNEDCRHVTRNRLHSPTSRMA